MRCRVLTTMLVVRLLVETLVIDAVR